MNCSFICLFARSLFIRWFASWFTNKLYCLFLVFQLFDMEVTDEFVEYASEGSLAIEVWGNRMKGFDSQNKVMLNWNVEPQQKGLHDR